MPKQPCVNPGTTHVILGHIKVTLVCIQTQPFDVSVSDSNMDDFRFFIGVRDPSDGMLLTLLPRTWTGVKAHTEIITLKKS
ncbi:MAG: hypothetical protein JHD00_03570 [Akkermansiaceae bacterium]|nr:hypothetical protein [Akkermansiaceae bacterium]